MVLRNILKPVGAVPPLGPSQFRVTRLCVTRPVRFPGALGAAPFHREGGGEHQPQGYQKDHCAYERIPAAHYSVNRHFYETSFEFKGVIETGIQAWVWDRSDRFRGADAATQYQRYYADCILSWY